MSDSANVFVVDEIDVATDRLAAVRDAYLHEYAPAARERGMVLLHDWLSPALLLKEGQARLTFIWSVAGMQGWWRMRLTASFDPAVEAFWQNLRPKILARTRRFHEAAETHV